MWAILQGGIRLAAIRNACRRCFLVLSGLGHQQVAAPVFYASDDNDLHALVCRSSHGAASPCDVVLGK